MKVITVLLTLCPVLCNAACFEEAAKRYRVPVSLLQAISRVESGGRVDALNKTNKNGSYDIGHMQINSAWLPVLNQYGITREKLWHPCTNTHVGAWILAQNISRLGYNWNAIGAYNAATPKKRMQYAQKISSVLQQGVLR